MVDVSSLLPPRALDREKLADDIDDLAARIHSLHLDFDQERTRLWDESRQNPDFLEHSKALGERYAKRFTDEGLWTRTVQARVLANAILKTDYNLSWHLVRLSFGEGDVIAQTLVQIATHIRYGNPEDIEINA